MKTREITGQRWLKFFGLSAITLYPLVLYQNAKPGSTLRTHEHIHMAQIRRDGWLRFHASYLWQYVRGRIRGLKHLEAYRAISYEAETYAHQDDLEYPARSV